METEGLFFVGGVEEERVTTEAHFVDDELDAVVSGLPGAAGYLVGPDGAGGFTETALAARPLPGADS